MKTIIIITDLLGAILNHEKQTSEQHKIVKGPEVRGE
jgi:hypothetical protein